MQFKKEYIYITFIIFIAFFYYCYNRRIEIGHYGHKLLCDYKLINHQHEIIPKLWLGDYIASQDKEFIKKKNIGLVINLSKTLNFIDNNSIKKYRIPIYDNLSKESNIGMIKHFDDAYNLIDNTLKSNKGVLIHCKAGVQRSATLIALYLMKKKNLTSNEAMKYIKSKRCIAFFHRANFLPVLKYYDYI